MNAIESARPDAVCLPPVARECMGDDPSAASLIELSTGTACLVGIAPDGAELRLPA